MIVETFKDVLGIEHSVTIAPDWTVTFNDNEPKLFSSTLGPLIVATIVKNFDSINDKSEIQQLSLDTYLEQLEDGYNVLDTNPGQLSNKEVGDKFDAFVRARGLLLRQNVYHVGKLSFKKILLLRDPTDTVNAERILQDVIQDDSNEEGRKVKLSSYITTFNDKRAKNNPRYRTLYPSKETLTRLNDGIVEVPTRAKSRKTKKTDTEDEFTTVKNNSSQPEDTSLMIDEHNSITFTDVGDYSNIVYQKLQLLDPQEILEEDDIRDMLISNGFNPRPSDIIEILIFATRNNLGFIDESGTNTQGVKKYKFVKK